MAAVDLLGRTIGPGDYLLVPRTDKQNLWMQFSRVLDVKSDGFVTVRSVSPSLEKMHPSGIGNLTRLDRVVKVDPNELPSDVQRALRDVTK